MGNIKTNIVMLDVTHYIPYFSRQNDLLDSSTALTIKILEGWIASDTILGADFLVLSAINRGDLCSPFWIV